ncbi:MAG: hypothetical protein QM368_06000 [Bacillota bacterium]|jgi:hypothetical protein|nr:hypothetical protein [Bacillota bacterium]HHU30193.1 hypothetical protein [Bacillota bacterium]
MSGGLKYLGSAFVLGLLLGLLVAGPAGTAFPRQKLQQNAVQGVLNGGAPGFAAGHFAKKAAYEGYLGIYKDCLAIYEGGQPPYGILQHVMQDYRVRDDIRPLLEKGMPFTDTYHLLRLLENCTT